MYVSQYRPTATLGGGCRASAIAASHCRSLAATVTRACCERQFLVRPMRTDGVENRCNPAVQHARIRHPVAPRIGAGASATV